MFCFCFLRSVVAGSMLQLNHSQQFLEFEDSIQNPLDAERTLQNIVDMNRQKNSVLISVDYSGLQNVMIFRILQNT